MLQWAFLLFLLLFNLISSYLSSPTSSIALTAPWYMYVYECLCVCVYMYEYLHVYIYVHINTHKYISTYIYICLCIYTHKYTQRERGWGERRRRDTPWDYLYYPFWLLLQLSLFHLWSEKYTNFPNFFIYYSIHLYRIPKSSGIFSNLFVKKLLL